MNYTPRGRERTEELERASLSTWATLAVETKGRDYEEEPDQLRTVFQQDCDRILSSTAFRRLAGKTHSVTAAHDRIARSRLEHTLAVVRLTRALARALRLNEDLAEAVALAHDLGSGPFAGADEEALSAFEQPFSRSAQGVRVVERLEGGGQGLNLSWEVRDGIAGHASDAAPPATIEGRCARLAARVIDVGDRLDDAVRSGAHTADDLPPDARWLLGSNGVACLATLGADIVACSADAPDVGLSPALARALDELDEFLTGCGRSRTAEQTRHARAVHCLRGLVVYWLANPDRALSDPAQRPSGETLLVRVLDRVCALTDAEAVQRFSQLLLPDVVV